ncbi:DMP19 family protein [Mesorhizobium sp. PL10]
MIVPRRDADKYMLSAVANFVETMLESADYIPAEIPPAALQAHACERYLGQVNNGGHSQFVRNSFDDLPVVVANVRAGLSAMSAERHLAVANGLLAWTIANPDDIARQTGFAGGRAAGLNELDVQFRAAEKLQPMDITAARWIARWPQLRIVPDSDYTDEIERAKTSNPLQAQRRSWRTVAVLTRKLNDRKAVAEGLRCTDTGVDSHRVDATILHARDNLVAVGLDLLLRRLGADPGVAAVIPLGVEQRPAGPVMTMALMYDPMGISIAVSDAQILLIVRDDEVLARANMDEIARHAHEVERGRL